MTDTCERCRQPFPGDHGQVIDGTYTHRSLFVYWLCPFHEEEA